jgi:hypothetical protein
MEERLARMRAKLAAAAPTAEQPQGASKTDAKQQKGGKR